MFLPVAERAGRSCGWRTRWQSQPLLYKDGRCERIDLTGFPLGIFEETQYDEWGVTLQAGDILVFHSDGIGGNDEQRTASSSAPRACCASSNSITK